MEAPRDIRKLAVILHEFTLPSPGQQLLDRFLAGYPRDGAFHKPPFQAALYIRGQETAQPELARREKAFGLVVSHSLSEALGSAQGILIAGAQPVLEMSALTRETIEKADAGARCFIYGSLGSDYPQAKALADLAAQRRIVLQAGTTLPWASRLPPVSFPAGVPLREALVVVQGEGIEAGLFGFEALWPMIEGRPRGEPGVRRLKFFADEEVWLAQAKGEWSTSLLAAALSRSNTPQGDPLADGRTQDLVGLGLVPKLARSPRAWLLEHRDGMRSAILVLNGVVRECNAATLQANGRIWSAQLYRPPLPTAPDFHRLADRLEEYYRTGKWAAAASRPLLTAAALEACRQSLREPKRWIEVSPL